jgi:hypothetical protein
MRMYVVHRLSSIHKRVSLQRPYRRDHKAVVTMLGAGSLRLRVAFVTVREEFLLLVVAVEGSHCAYEAGMGTLVYLAPACNARLHCQDRTGCRNLVSNGRFVLYFLR